MAENIAALKALFPTIVADGKVEFEVLRQLLGRDACPAESRIGAGIGTAQNGLLLADIGVLAEAFSHGLHFLGERGV